MHAPRTASALANRRAGRLLAALVAAATGAATLALAAPAQAQGDATAVHAKVVSADPADFTPFVKDGVVESIVQVGNTIVIGGTFTQLIRGTTTYPRTSLAAFDATTGVISPAFAPSVNGEVTSLAVSADGQSVYAGGTFTTVNGVAKKRLALIKVSDGSLVTSFKPKPFSSGVNDLRRVGNTLWVAGRFNKNGSTVRPALVTVDATTGVLTNQSTVVFSGLHNGGTLAVRELALTPAADKLIAIGNFTSVNGLPRDQVVMLDISGATATVSGWQTNFFTSSCASVFDTFMRDVAISPDGSYVVFVTTGAFRANTSCDTISRFELNTTASGLTPTWVNMTGGDTTTAVAIVGPVVYVGGHFRWVNNSSAGDRAGQGAIERTGLAALNPLNGMPYPWNPTRERGYGVYDFLATDQGLWVGSDTDLIGNEYHPRIGFFPLAGGSSLPPGTVGSLPGQVLTVSPGASTTNTVTSTQVDGSALPSGTTTMTSSDSWGSARGAMLVDGTLFTAWTDRLLYASQVSGTTIGARTQVNLNAGPLCTSSSGTCAGAFSLDTPSITGMFYDSGRMYYTLSGSSSLYYRYFEPQGGYVGATRYQATGAVSTLNPSRVRGMFLASGKIHLADASNGRLYSIGFSAGVVGSSLVEVDASRDWRARGLALLGEPPANQDPTAVIGVSCAFLACQFSGTGSTDNDGTIESYAWDFGDGATSQDGTPAHPFATGGTYTVTLTVTDDDGATDTATREVTVAAVPASNVSFRAGSTAFGTLAVAKATVPAATQSGDQLLLFVSANAAVAFTTPAGWALVAERQDGTPDLVTRVYRRTAAVTDPGTVVSVPLASSQKVATTLLAYSGVDTSVAPVVASAAEPGATASHAAPPVPVTQPGSWVVSYWADKGAGTTSWTLPGSLVQRGIVLGTGSGTVSGVTGDTAGPVPTGTWPGATATSSTSSGKATSFSIVLVST